MSASATAEWLRVLEELEAELDAVGAALEAGDDVPTSDWTPPQDLGPPPEELRERLRALALRLTAVHQRTRLRMTELGEELANVDRRRRAGAAYNGEPARP